MYCDYNNEDAPFAELLGKTIMKINGLKKGSADVNLVCSDGTEYTMRYYDDCCATCDIEDIIGDVGDILNSPILLAEEVSSNEKLTGQEDSESFTWTFYKLATIKGNLTIRWYGSSNGYYSESATFERVGNAL